MLNEAKNLATAMLVNEDPRWLTLLGTAGVGKTHLAKCLLKFWRSVSGWRVIKGKAGEFQSLGESRFLSWRMFMDRQRDGQFSELQDLRTVPFLVIDDIGAEHDPTGFAKAKLDDLIDSRLRKWTVITSNLSLGQISTQLDTRIASRMLRGGSKVVTASVTDFNLRKSQVTKA